MREEQYRVDTLLSAYENDRNEERMRKNNLYAIFSTFILLIVGMVNMFNEGACVGVGRGVIILSFAGVCFLYSFLHVSLIRELNYVERCKKGREICIRSVNSRKSEESIIRSDYNAHIIRLQRLRKMGKMGDLISLRGIRRKRLMKRKDNAVRSWKERNPDDFPFYEFKGVKVKQSKHLELLVIAWVAGAIGSGFILK